MSATGSGRAVEVRLGSRAYEVRFEPLEAALVAFGALVGRDGPGHAVVVVDENVWAAHDARIERALAPLSCPITRERLTASEPGKTPEAQIDLCQRLLRAGLDRSGLVIAIGGGVTLDVAGFAAATYHRGVPWIAVPTTTLAMADASVGGKTGVNLGGVKNAVGAFHQPLGVVCDLSFLETLSPRDRRAGLAEVVKVGVVADAELFVRLEEEGRRLAGDAPEALEAVLERAVVAKAGIVATDERDRGARAVLNFGHTVGHALESASRYVRYRHGEAVSIGMRCAARLSVVCAGLDRASEARIVSLLEALELPVTGSETPWSSIEAHLSADKKRSGGAPGFVLTPRIGFATFGQRISQAIVKREVAGFFGDRAP